MANLLRPLEKSLSEIFENSYSIPVFQRPYNWDEENVDQLLIDIQEAFRYYVEHDRNKDAEDAILFVGTMFIVPINNDQTVDLSYDVVDGQQRITTLTLILMAILHHFNTSGAEETAINEIRRLLWKDQHINKPVLTLGNIDKEILAKLMNMLFRGEDIIEYANNRLDDPQIKNVEERLLNNLTRISKHIRNIEETEIIDYFDFIKDNIRAITVAIDTPSKKLFSIFESINSKGKHLDEIDLIKSYIFQELDKSDYDEYLNKWGTLIHETDDRLKDYFLIFIRANIKFTKQDIGLKRFKGLTQSDLKDYYEKESTKEVLKSFVDDLVDNVNYFKMLSDYTALRNAGVSEEALSFFVINDIAGYKTTQPYLFKLLTLRFPCKIVKTLAGSIRKIPSPENGYFKGNLFNSLSSSAVKFMMTFQSISGKESKDAIKTFQQAHEILKDLTPSLSATIKLGFDEDAKRKEVQKAEEIERSFEQTIHDTLISNEIVSEYIKSLQSRNNNIFSSITVKILLAFLNATDDQGRIDYAVLNDIITRHKAFNITPILPKDLQRNLKYKYYLVGESIYLEKGQDFISPHKNRVPADEFLKTYIFRIGNLKLSWRNDRAKSEASHITLKDHDLDYTCNQEVEKREKSLVNQLIRSPLIIRPDDYTPTVAPIYKPDERIITRRGYSFFPTKDYKPVSFTLLGKEKELDHPTWKQLVYEIMVNLFEFNEARLVSLSNERYKTSRGTIWISPNKNDLGASDPIHIGRNINVRSNFGPAQALSFCFEILSRLRIRKEDLTIVAVKRR